MSTTAANVHDVTEAHRLLHGGERRVWGDAYQGVEKRAENRDMDVEWLAMRRTASETEGGELRGLGGEEQIIHQG